MPPDWFQPQCLAWFFTMHTVDPDYWCVAESLIPMINATPHSSCYDQTLFLVYSGRMVGHH